MTLSLFSSDDGGSDSGNHPDGRPSRGLLDFGPLDYRLCFHLGYGNLEKWFQCVCHIVVVLIKSVFLIGAECVLGSIIGMTLAEDG